MVAGLARQCLEYARGLEAELIVTDSALCADWMLPAVGEGDPAVRWLPELVPLGWLSEIYFPIDFQI